MPIHPEVKKYLSDIGRKGGSRSSIKKKASSPKNGILGGRPKKNKVSQ